MSLVMPLEDKKDNTFHVLNVSFLVSLFTSSISSCFQAMLEELVSWTFSLCNRSKTAGVLLWQLLQKVSASTYSKDVPFFLLLFE